MNYEQSTSLTPNKKYKIVVLGDSYVGKTSLVEKIVMNRFDEKQKSTVCLDTFKKTVMHDGQMVHLFFWDTAGQEKYHSIIPSTIRDYDCAILVYDLSEPETFKNCVKWAQMLSDANPRENAPKILVGNKTDLPRQVSASAGLEWALKHNLSYLQVSARSGQNVENIVEQILSGMETVNKSEKSTNRSQNSSSPNIKLEGLKQNADLRGKLSASCCSI